MFTGTSLFWATVKGMEDIVELLIWNGAQISSKNKTGCAPLHAACDGNQLAIARYVILRYVMQCTSDSSYVEFS